MEGVVFIPVDILFNLTFQPLFIFYGVLFLLNISSLIFLIRKKIQPAPLKVMIFFIVTLAFWSIASIFESLANNSLTSYYWSTIGSVAWGILPSIILIFALIYTKNRLFKQNALLQILVFLPSIVFLQLTLSTDFLSGSFIMPVYIVWLGVVFAVSLFLLLKFYRSLTDSLSVKQALDVFFALGLMSILVISCGSILILQNANGFSNLLLLFFTIGSIHIMYSLTRNNQYSFEPGEIIPDIIDTMKEAIIVINSTSLKVEYVNKTASNLLNTSTSSLLGVNILKLIRDSEEDVLAYFSGIEKTAKRATPWETILITTKNLEIPVTFIATPYATSDQASSSIVIIVSDQSQIKELLNIGVEQKKLEAIIESIADGVITLDMTGKIKIINSSATDTLQLDRSDVIGKSFKELIVFAYAEANLDIDRFLTDSINFAKPFVFKNSRVITGNANIEANLTISKLLSADQSDQGLVITIHDLTEEKQLADKKLDFVTIATHELRTPLTGLKGLTYLWLKDNATQNDQANKVIQRMSESADKLIDLVGRLLKTTKIEKGS